MPRSLASSLTSVDRVPIALSGNHSRHQAARIPRDLHNGRCCTSRPRGRPGKSCTDRSVRLGPCYGGGRGSGERRSLLWVGAARSMSTYRSSIVSTAPAQSYWRAFSIGWTRISARTRVVEGHNTNAARLIALYRERRGDRPAPQSIRDEFSGVGSARLQLSCLERHTRRLILVGRYAAALPKATAKPDSVDWGSLPRLMQEIGAQALPVTSAANLLVGVIVGFLGVSQLGRFGAVSYVPELVVVAHFRELGPLVTAIVVAGRSGAGLASEIATMKVSEEIDALRSMGFDPLRWLVVPRCLALAATVPLLTWVGDAVALIGGMGATLRHHANDGARLSPGDHVRDHPRSLAGGPRQESVSGTRDRIDRMLSGPARTGRRRRCRRPDDDRRGSGHFWRDRDQRRVYVLPGDDRRLTCRY